MPDPLRQAFARSEEEAITLRILQQHLVDDERMVEEALELNVRERHSLELALSQTQLRGRPVRTEATPKLPNNRWEETQRSSERVAP